LRTHDPGGIGGKHLNTSATVNKDGAHISGGLYGLVCEKTSFGKT